jgi:trimethylamine--corrinoid protein Co-methyltransferase
MIPHYNVLSDSEINMIHEGALAVLENTGLVINHPFALERLADAGANVAFNEKRVRIPRDLVGTCLEKAPNKFVCGGQTPGFDFTMDFESTKIRTGGGSIYVMDWEKGEQRPLTYQDNADFARLTDALENIHVFSTLTPNVSDVTYTVHTLKDALLNTQKHIWALVNDSRVLKFQLEMALAVSGSKEELIRRPRISGIVCIIEPLFFPHDEIERLLQYGEYKVPLKVPFFPVGGANSPITLAGELTMINAEFLGSMTLIHTLCPGNPCAFHTGPQTMELRSGNSQMNSPEVLLMHAAISQLARYYNVPSSQSQGTMNCWQDHQFLMLSSLALMNGVLCGASDIGGVGSFGNANVVNHAAFVIVSELAEYIFRYQHGFSVNESTIGVEAINRVGPQKDFLTDDHTMTHLRQEKRFIPSLIDWSGYESWIENPTSIIERAQAKVDDILNNYVVEPLPEDVQQELHRIAVAADKELLDQ